jgi:hypothetical protein
MIRTRGERRSGCLVRVTISLAMSRADILTTVIRENVVVCAVTDGSHCSFGIVSLMLHLESR